MTNPLVCLQYLQSQLYGLCVIDEEKRQTGRKLIEKIEEFSHAHSFVIVICSAYFGAQKRRKCAKSVGVNKSESLSLRKYKLTGSSTWLLLNPRITPENILFE